MGEAEFHEGVAKKQAREGGKKDIFLKRPCYTKKFYLHPVAGMEPLQGVKERRARTGPEKQLKTS